MSPSFWLVVHLVAAAVLAGVGWVVQLVVYPAFRLVGAREWARYHDRHMRAITRVVAVPWLAQGVSAAALLLAPAAGGPPAAVVLAALALVTVAATIGAAVPAHGRLVVAPAARRTSPCCSAPPRPHARLDGIDGTGRRAAG